MFTGIIEHQGRVATLRAEPWGARLEIDPCGWVHRPSDGDSVAVQWLDLPDGEGWAVVDTGSRDRTVQLWDSATGRPIGEPIVHTCEVHQLALSQDGSRLLTGSLSDAKLDVGPRDRKVQVWDTKTGKTVCRTLNWAGRTWRGYWFPIALSPDGKTALTATGDWDAQLWDATTGERIGKPMSTLNRSSSRWFLAAAFSPDSTKVATGADRKSTRLNSSHRT